MRYFIFFMFCFVFFGCSMLVDESVEEGFEEDFYEIFEDGGLNEDTSNDHINSRDFKTEGLPDKMDFVITEDSLTSETDTFEETDTESGTECDVGVCCDNGNFIPKEEKKLCAYLELAKLSCDAFCGGEATAYEMYAYCNGESALCDTSPASAEFIPYFYKKCPPDNWCTGNISAPCRYHPDHECAITF